MFLYKDTRRSTIENPWYRRGASFGDSCSSEEATKHRNRLLESIADFFSSNGLGRFVLNLRIKRTVERKVSPYWRVLIESQPSGWLDSDEFEEITRLRTFLNAYIKGKGRLYGVFPSMSLFRVRVPEQTVLACKFKVSYAIELVDKVDEEEPTGQLEFIEKEKPQKYVNFYPFFFPNWLGSTDLFRSLNDAIIQLHATRVKIDLRSATFGLHKDGTATVVVTGSVNIATVNNVNDLLMDVSLEIQSNPISLTQLVVPTDKEV